MQNTIYRLWNMQVTCNSKLPSLSALTIKHLVKVAEGVKVDNLNSDEGKGKPNLFDRCTIWVSVRIVTAPLEVAAAAAAIVTARAAIPKSGLFKLLNNLIVTLFVMPGYFLRFGNLLLHSPWYWSRISQWMWRFILRLSPHPPPPTPRVDTTVVMGGVLVHAVWYKSREIKVIHHLR